MREDEGCTRFEHMFEGVHSDAMSDLGGLLTALLHVEDGWRYFVHGWTQVVAEVFDVPMPPDTVDELGRIAARLR